MKSVSVHRTFLVTLLTIITLIFVAGVSLLTYQQSHAQAPQAASVSKLISQDPFTNTSSQHQTQVEPDTFSHGSTVVSAFQSGRFYAGGGSSGISWATSTDAGHTWKTGTLPGITIYAGGTYGRVSDSVVAYDLAHHTWLIASPAIPTTTVNGSTAVVVSRSSDGLNWSAPVTISASGPNNNWDKEWIVCDQTSSSPFYGRCYAEWDDSANSGRIMMSYSNDGGLTWSMPNSPAHQSFSAIGGQPVVQPNGNVIVPIYGYDLTTSAEGLYAYTSTDGGATWTDPMKIAPSTYFVQAASYRGGSLPSAEIDATGKVYLAWAGCYFEPTCSSDDIVFTTTTDGATWTPLQRIPLNPIGSGVEHVTAGLAVDRTTSGGSAHLAVTYYYFPKATCTNATCKMFTGFATSINGGASWSKSKALAGPTALTWYANTTEGYMTGDYISTSIASNRGVAVFPVAQAPTGTQLNEAMYSASLKVTGGTIPSETLPSSVSSSSQPQKVPATKDYHTAN